MKIVEFADGDYPTQIDVLPNGDGVFVDCIWWYDLEVGDMVQALSEMGTTCYLVVDKQPTTTSELGDGVYNIVIRAM